MAKSKANEEKEEDQTVEDQEAVVDAENPKGDQREEIIIGTVIWFNKARKGYGFATMDGEKEGDNDIFIHSKQFAEGIEISDLNPGDKISFILIDPPADSSKKKPIAGEIKLLEQAKEEEEGDEST